MVIGSLVIGLNIIYSVVTYFAESYSNMAYQSCGNPSNVSNIEGDSTAPSSSRKSLREHNTIEKRVEKFEKMPTPHYVAPNALAKAGFIYSRSRKCTICTGCEKIVGEWKTDDQPGDPRFHNEGCQFVETTEPLDLSKPNSESGEPQPMEDTMTETAVRKVPTPEDCNIEPMSLPVKLHPHKNAQTMSMPPLNLSQKPPAPSPAPSSTTDELHFERLTPLHMIQSNQSRGSTPLPNFSAAPRRDENVIQSEPIFGNSARDRSTPSISRQNRSVSAHKGVRLPEEIANLDMSVAENRLETFERFWSRSNVFRNIRLLVICGFFCFGQGDAVQCFFCGVILANWSRNDDPRRRHLALSPKCRFARGENCGNTSLPVLQRGQRNRSHQSRHSADRTERYSSSDGRQSTAAPTPAQDQLPEAYANMTRSQRERNNLMIEFPCENPYNEAMRDERLRLESFRNSSFRMNTQLRKSNESLAQAGLYYEGVGDCTKCWYCGGGLKNYLPNDDPWVEHAKYFAECEYLLQQRGPAWVTSISIQFRNDVRHNLPQTIATGGPSSGSTSTISSSQSNAVLDEAMRTQPVEDARRMGFQEQLIRQVQQRRILSLGSCYQTSETLMEALLHPDVDPSTIEAMAHQQNDFLPPPRRQNIVIAGGNFVGPGSFESAVAQQNLVTHQPPIGQPLRRNIVVTGGNFVGPSIINGRLYPASSSRSQTTVNGLPLQEYLGGGDDPMEVETEQGPTHIFNNIGGTVSASGRGHGSSSADSPLPTQTALSQIQHQDTSNSGASSASVTGSADERLEALQREHQCKICYNAPVEVLFLPCQHACACVECSRRVGDCPVCRRRIARNIRMYSA